MADEFTLDVDPSLLSAAEKTLGEIGAQFEEEGGKLAALPGQASDLSGGTASTITTAMSTLAADMRQAAPHFATAVTAVATLRQAIERAQQDLVGLNRSWADSIETHDAAVATADTSYQDAKSGTPPAVWRAEEQAMASARSTSAPWWCARR